ncbi:MAG: hypothetical protein ABSG86_01190 [Thermoguttaceae bacterium]|jgi:hypothetical protein
MKTWSCPKKIAARADTIIALGPVKGQYWSMAGLCDGPGCEVDQVLNSGIVMPEQFHGVEIQRDIYDANVAVYPELHWHHGDFLQVMQAHPDFRPGLVNADLLQSVDTAADYVARLLYFLTPHDAKLVVNFVMECRGYRTTTDHVIERLMQCQQFRYAVRRGWTHGDRCYLYPGTSHRPRTVMGTFIFQHP